MNTKFENLLDVDVKCNYIPFNGNLIAINENSFLKITFQGTSYVHQIRKKKQKGGRGGLQVNGLIGYFFKF